MTEKEIVEKLKNYKNLTRLIEVKNREIARLTEEKYTVSLPTCAGAAGQKSSVSDPTFKKVWEIMQKYDEDIQRLADEAQKLREEKRKTEEMVESLPYIERTVLIMRYFQCKKWFVIENTLHYGQRTPFYIQKRAIKMLLSSN